MGQERLNHLMLSYVHKERTDKLDLKFVLNEFILNEFVGQSEHLSSLQSINILAKYSK